MVAVSVTITVPVAVAISVVIVVSALAGLVPVVAGLAVGILRHGNKSLMVVGSTRWKWLSLWARYLASCRRMRSLEQGGHYSDPRRSLAVVCKYEARAFPDGPILVWTEYPRMGGVPSCLPASVKCGCSDWGDISAIIASEKHACGRKLSKIGQMTRM